MGKIASIFRRSLLPLFANNLAWAPIKFIYGVDPSPRMFSYNWQAVTNNKSPQQPAAAVRVPNRNSWNHECGVDKHGSESKAIYFDIFALIFLLYRFILPLAVNFGFCRQWQANQTRRTKKISKSWKGIK